MDEANKIVLGSELDGSYRREGWLAVFVNKGKRYVIYRNTDAGYDGVDVEYLDGGYTSHLVNYGQAGSLFKTMDEVKSAIGKIARRFPEAYPEAVNAEIHKVAFALTMKWVL